MWVSEVFRQYRELKMARKSGVDAWVNECYWELGRLFAFRKFDGQW